jgi:polysaccharide chain length determinant protein (PEP-CTERM system associated)
MNSQQIPQMPDIGGMIRRRLKLMLTVAAIGFLALYLVAMALPNQYTSSATILVEPQAVDEGLVSAGVRESDLKERLGIMTAEILRRARLSRLIDEFDLYAEESASKQRSEVIDIMRAHVVVEPVLNALDAQKRQRAEVQFNSFKITFTSRSATTAAVVAQSIANDFLEANIDARVNVSRQSLDFMQDSIEELSGQLTQVEGQVKSLKDENAGHLPENLAANQESLQISVGQLRDVRRALDLALSDEAFWKDQAITAGAMTGMNDQASPAYRRKVVESELSVMRARGYTARHPDVVQAVRELALLEGRLEGSGDGEDEPPESYAEQNAKSEERRSALRVEALGQDVERLTEQGEAARERIAATPAVAALLEALGREYSHLNVSFQDFSARRQQASVQADLERKQLGEQFRILESAFPAPSPSSPNRRLILFVGLVLGVGLAGTVGLVLESIDSSVHDSRSLQAATSVPVLASIPAIMLEPDFAARRRRLIREVLVAGCIAVVCIMAGALSYVYVNDIVIFPDSGEEEGEAQEEAAGARAFTRGVEFRWYS